MKTLHTRLASEFLGTAFLVAAVIGSGIMGERLSSGNVAIALLRTQSLRGAALVALILTFGPISGARLNPVVTIADAWEGGIPWTEAVHYLWAQIFGGIGGAIAAHLMFGLPIVSLSQHVRTTPPQWFSEFVATFGLLSVIWRCSRRRSSGVPFAVGSSAVTIARCMSDTFAGIRPIDVPGFVLAQFLGGFAATLLFHWWTAPLE